MFNKDSSEVSETLKFPTQTQLVQPVTFHEYMGRKARGGYMDKAIKEM